MTAQLKDHRLTKGWILGSATLGFFALTSIAAMPAQALVITTDCIGESSCTLQELNDGGTIQVGDKLFTDWDVMDAFRSFPFLPIPLDLDNIEVSGIFQDTNAPGLEFMSLNNELSIPSGQNITLNFDFLVTSSGEPIVDNELSLDDFAVFGGFSGDRAFIEIFEDVGTTKGDDDLAKKFVEYEAQSLIGVVRDKQFDSATFPPQESIWVRKNINMFSTVEASASLTKFSQRFSQVSVPEPTSTLSLLALGTLGAASTFKRKKKQDKLTEKKQSNPHNLMQKTSSHPFKEMNEGVYF